MVARLKRAIAPHPTLRFPEPILLRREDDSGWDICRAQEVVAVALNLRSLLPVVSALNAVLVAVRRGNKKQNGGDSRATRGGDAARLCCLHEAEEAQATFTIDWRPSSGREG